MTIVKEEYGKKTAVMWQEVEHAILVIRWNNSIEIVQGKNSILIQDESEKELLKLLKEAFGQK